MDIFKDNNSFLFNHGGGLLVSRQALVQEGLNQLVKVHTRAREVGLKLVVVLLDDLRRVHDAVLLPLGLKVRIWRFKDNRAAAQDLARAVVDLQSQAEGRRKENIVEGENAVAANHDLRAVADRNVKGRHANVVVLLHRMETAKIPSERTTAQETYRKQSQHSGTMNKCFCTVKC